MLFRLVFAATLALCVIALDTQTLAMSLILFCVVLLYTRGAKTILFIRSLRLLFWLYVPIILFHGFFTPGSYIFNEFVLPFSAEGLEQGLFLCLRMTAMFFVALLISRLLKMSEFVFYLNKLPRLANKTLPYIFLLSPLKGIVSSQLMQQKEVWVNQGKSWSLLPDLFVQSIEAVIKSSTQEATKLWHNWDTQTAQFNQQKTGVDVITRFDLGYGLLTLMVWYLLWIK